MIIWGYRREQITHRAGCCLTELFADLFQFYFSLFVVFRIVVLALLCCAMARLIPQRDRHALLLFIICTIVILWPRMGAAQRMHMLQNIGLLLLLLEARRPQTSTPRRLRTISSFADQEQWDMRSNFRFEANELFRLRDALDLPRFRLHNRAVYVGEEALLVFLARIHIPGRWYKIRNEFGGSSSRLSEVFNMVVRYLYFRFCIPLLQNLRHWAPYFDVWCATIARKSEGAVDFVFGFLDGHFNTCCQPVLRDDGGQLAPDVLYSGYYKEHGLKYQHLTAPNGLTIHLPPPFVGSTHDQTMLTQSTLLTELAQIIAEKGRHYCMYADLIYSLSIYCMTGFRRTNPQTTPAQREWTRRLNGPRTSVEWCIGKVGTVCAATTDERQQKVGLQNLGMIYSTATLIANCHTCCYGSVCNQYFETFAPSLEEYLNLDEHP